MGTPRKRKLNENVILFAKSLFMVGTSREAVYRLISNEFNISRTTLYRWKNLGQEYSQIQDNGGQLTVQQKRFIEWAELEDTALAFLENRLLYRMVDIACGDIEKLDFRAISFLLERKFPDLYGRRAPIVVRDEEQHEEGALFRMLRESIDSPPGWRILPEQVIGEGGEILESYPADTPESYAARIMKSLEE